MNREKTSTGYQPGKKGGGERRKSQRKLMQ
jgi:hypothetical protein